MKPDLGYDNLPRVILNLWLDKKEYEELTVDEIAERTGWSRSTVQKRLNEYHDKYWAQDYRERGIEKIARRFLARNERTYRPSIPYMKQTINDLMKARV